VTQSSPVQRLPTPEEIALAYDALVETLWMIWDQAAVGGPNFADQVAHALGEVAVRPDDSLQETPSDAGTMPQPQAPLSTGVTVDRHGDGRA
jgi:hypothetical protein